MKANKRALDERRTGHRRWLNFTLAALVGVGLGVGQGFAAAGGNQPIQTKTSRLAAMEAAAQAAQAAAQPQVAIMALPTSTTDEAAVPHYFGPFPNWANSPFTLGDATVEITGDGTGAAATATVGANGAVTGLTITNPGQGYTSAVVTITGSGTGATADAAVTGSGSVVAITVDSGGAGYTAPQVTIDPPPAGTTATATAYSGVDFVNLDNPGSGYTNPTVDFDMPDGPDGVKAVAHAVTVDNGDGTVTITGIAVDQPGSGYSIAPNVVIRNGTLYDPVPGGTDAAASATLSVQTVTLDTFGSGYTSDPAVTITDASGTGTGATATAVADFGAVTSITLTNPGSGYITAGGMQKFVDALPGLCDPSGTLGLADCTTASNGLGQYLPVGVPDTATFTIANGFADDSDYYQIALVQFRKRMSSSLPAQGTLLRAYVQLETPANAGWSKHVPLCNADLLTDACTPILRDGVQVYGVEDPQFLGPVILATKDKPVRVTFFNFLPTGAAGDLYIPTDSTLTGSGYGPLASGWPEPENLESVMDGVRNPVCSQYPKDPSLCFKDSRATLHLHGGLNPWISDGTPHQWSTPETDTTVEPNPWPEGQSVGNVPDMSTPESIALGVPDCSGDNDGCQTFYYTNQQSARLMFYHDHAFGTTRLNVYLGEAAGYMIADATEQKLIDTGTIPGPLDTIPLIVQDRTFVPADHAAVGDAPTQLDLQDPTWDSSRWGGYGNFWYHHVYMPAQNPGNPSGMSAFGRWMYGPWFWPPATPMYGPIPNPYYNMDPATGFTTPLAVPCSLDDPATWQYQTDPFCEPLQIPGTPNISTGMEQFNDTPFVNGTAYPTITVEPKAYRLRFLNAANDRFFNFQLYPADPTTESTSTNAAGDPIGGTEVALDPIEVAAAQLDPVVFPTPVLASKVVNGTDVVSTAGPDWIVIGNEGGFLPTPAVVDGQQPTTWITDPTRFDVGNVDKHSLLIAPAERSDVVVDFSQFAGQTLILYNDAPAAFPARVPSYDYYTGAPDLFPAGAPSTLPGYGPNTRTIMQIKVAASTPAAPFDVKKLKTAFLHKADGSGVFEEGQHPIIVGQAPYNPAYGTSFVASGDCNTDGTTLCDGLLRIDNQGGTPFAFNTLITGTSDKIDVMIEPKGIHDEMNSATFDEFGRMTANMGLEVVPATAGLQNIVLYPYVNPPTELIDGTNLPSSMTVTPIKTGTDGTQIWKITHNGVDTHPIHFHLYDVQLLNRVTWDNIIIPNDPDEYGWKDTVRVSPLEDTIVALRPVMPELPFDLPNSVRMLNPALPEGAQVGFANIDADGNPTTPIVNQLVNFGGEYVWHCHILSHEEMDMMRPQSLALPPYIPSGLAWSISGTGTDSVVNLTWSDNSINETEFLVQKSADLVTWADLATVASPLDQPNTTGTRTYTDTTFNPNEAAAYRVIGQNTVGYGGAFMSLTAKSQPSNSVAVIQAPTDLTASLTTGPAVRLIWIDNATNETGFVIERATNGGAFTQIATLPARFSTGSMSYLDSAVTVGDSYEYRVAAVNATGSSAYSNTASMTVDVPLAPSSVTGVATYVNNARETVTLNWTDNSNNESRFEIQRAADANFTTAVANAVVAADVTTYTSAEMARRAWYFRVRAVNVVGASAWVDATPTPIPAALP